MKCFTLAALSTALAFTFSARAQDSAGLDAAEFKGRPYSPYADRAFPSQVYFGDTIVTKIWKTGAGEAIIQGETQKGNIVLSQAKVSYQV